MKQRRTEQGKPTSGAAAAAGALTCSCSVSTASQLDLSQRGLGAADARLVKMALVQNPNVKVLKLCYNNLGDDGVAVLASGVAQHAGLESLDLGFNGLGDEGCRALLRAIPHDNRRVWTLHLAGNCIGEDGALALADWIRRRCLVRKLYLTGNRLGPGGVRSIADAILHEELARRHSSSGTGPAEACTHPAASASYGPPAADSDSAADSGKEGSGPSAGALPGGGGMQELFLGGTHMGVTGFDAVARLVGRTRHLRTLSLSNCDITDDLVERLATHIKANREHLPLEALHLCFNRITCIGMEYLSNAIWGSTHLTELLIDNNEIGDGGAQFVATVLPSLTNLQTLNVGFNKIKSPGMKLLMKAVAESSSLVTLSVSGNPVDTTSAKFIAYALAYNNSLNSISLDHCSINNEGQRHIVAGIVSNSQISVREIRGFDISPVIVTLGFPSVMEHWNNEHVMNFIHLMWERSRADTPTPEEATLDPLHFLPTDGNGRALSRAVPLEAAVVVDIAKKAFQSLVQEGVDVFSRRPGHLTDDPVSPVSADGIFLVQRLHQDVSDNVDSASTATGATTLLEPLPTLPNRSFVTPPEEAPRSAAAALPDPSRKKRIVEWLCTNIQHLNKLAQKPFSSAELWQLHQHYFTPVVNESGGCGSGASGTSLALSQDPLCAAAASSVPEVSRAGSSVGLGASFGESVEGSLGGGGGGGGIPASDPFLKPTPNLTSFPMLKRKVSYRFLGDAALASTPTLDLRNSQSANGMLSVSMMIEGGPAGHTLPPKTKRARRNRSRISFLPRVKAKLDSFLDVCHEKALVTMRQLYYVEQAVLRGEVNPIDPKTTSRTHLCGDFAADAETIVVDMI